MFRIQILDAEGHLIHQVPLGGKPLSFGRDPQSSVCLPEINVSRRHALIEPYGNFFVVKDLGSTNGIWIDGKPVKTHILRAGDRIQMGTYRILVDETQGASEAFRAGSPSQITETAFDFDPSESSHHTLRLSLGKETGFLLSRSGSERLERLHAVCQELSLIETPEALYPKVLEVVLIDLHAERAAFLIADADGRVEPAATLSAVGASDEVFAIHEGVLRTVTGERTALLTEDARLDARLRDPGMPSSGPPVRSVLCVPLVSKGRLLGALYADRLNDATPFSGEDLGVLAVVANHVAVSLLNARLFADVLVEKRRLQSVIDNLADGLVITDAGLAIEKFNGSAARTLAGKQKNLVGRNLGQLLKALDADLDTKRLGAIVARLGSFRLTIQRDDNVLAYMVSVAPYPHAGGEGHGYIFCFRDSTEFLNLESLKAEFMRTASHRLRTPLTVIMGNLELLRGELQEQAIGTMATVLECMDSNLEQLRALVNRLVDFTELDAAEEDFEAVPLGEVLQVAWSGLTVAADEKRLRLRRVSLCEREAMVPGLVDRLIQCFTNLLDNAIRHSPPGSEVVIELEDDGPAYAVHICDQGPGIPPKALPYIFSGFYHGDSRVLRASPGLGLGLTVARRIVTIHGATISVASPDPKTGKGARFTVRLLKERPQTPHSIYLQTEAIVEPQ